MGVASGRQAVIVKERTLGPVSERVSNVRSSLVPRILTDPRGSTFISERSRVDGGNVMRRGAARPVWTRKLTGEESVNPALAVSTYIVCQDVR